MKINIVILIILFLYSCSSAEERITTSTYINGKVKQEKIFKNGKKDSLNYILKQYNYNGTIEMVGEFKDGKENGVFKWYYSNGNKKWIEKYRNGKSVDTTYCYYESGELKRMAITLNNSTIKEATEYYESGEVKIKSFINNGDYIDSLWIGYYKNGQIKESGKVSKGEKVGIWKFYNDEGILLDSVDQTGMSKIVFDFEIEEIKEQNSKNGV